MVRSLTWRQVNAWRLAQHGLAPRLPHPDMVRAVTLSGGIQAQVMSAAEMGLWARIDGITPRDVQSALWQERMLIKTWAMRAALHLIAPGDLPLYVAARSVYGARNWEGYFAYYGIDRALYETYLAAVPQVLSDTPLTRLQLADALAEHTGAAALRALVLSESYGLPLQPSAWRGDLCFGPSQGRTVTFVRPSAWLKRDWQPLEPFAALQEVARRYLRTYGPATPQDFARWWWGGQGLALTRKIFRSLHDELEPVDIEGWSAVALQESVEPMSCNEPAGSVNLLPLFDAYVLCLGRGADLEPLLPQVYQRQVYRPQGWISAVVLVDGFIKGVWQYATRRGQVVVKVRLFWPPDRALKKGIAAEAERLGTFLDTDVVVEYEDGAGG